VDIQFLCKQAIAVFLSLFLTGLFWSMCFKS